MISGEQVNYTYDALNRLATAQTSSNPSVTQWGQSFTYDGFGNLTNVNVIAGSAPTYSANYNPATNQQYSDCADLNGNLNSTAGSGCTGGNSYDIENRLVSPPGPVWGAGGSSETWYYYGYAPGNKRVWRGSWEEQVYNCQPGGVGCEYSWSRPTDIVAFYAPNGQKLAEYSLSYYYGSDVDCEPENPVFYAIQNGTYYYFGGRMIKNQNGWVYPDRLGSIGKFYPYGTERPSATTNGTEKFTGYFRDAETGNDYAINRYELPGQGRFSTPDMSRASNAAMIPSNWNLYTYVGGDPVNKADPLGLCSPEDDPPCFPITVTGDSPDGGGGGLGGSPQPINDQGPKQSVGSSGPVGTTFARAQAAFQADAKNIAKMSFKPGCEWDLTALKVTNAQVVAAASQVVFVNALGSNAGLSSLYATSPVASVQQAGATLTGTVGSFVASNPGTVAVAQLGGNAVYINAGLINPTDYYQDISVVLHELLHNITGLTDPDIETALGLPTTGPNGAPLPSDVITQKLKKDCF